MPGKFKKRAVGRCERWGGPKVVSMELLLLVNFVACGGAVCELLLMFFCALKTRVKKDHWKRG